MKVNIISANHIELETSEGVAFQSYKSIVALKHDGKISLSNHWDYSKTTIKHLSKWLNMNSKEIRTNIKNGLIKVDIDTNGNFNL